MPKISVVIPCYNHGAYLDEAVASVLAQTCPDFEIIIVDDGSPELATRDLLAGYARPHTRVLRTAHAGVAAARNHGIAQARGDYVLPLDADDRIAPAYLEQAAAVLDRRPEVGIVYCKAELFGALHGEWLTPDFSLPHMLLDNLIFSAALFRRDDWLKVGGYSERMRTGWEDWDFWLKLLGLGQQTVRLPEILFAYRISRGSREQSLGTTQKVGLWLQLLVRHRRLFAANATDFCCILISGSRRRPAAIKVG